MSDIWKNWCRLCAKEEKNINIHENEEGLMLLRISKYLSIKFQDDGLPKSICDSCSNVLSEFDAYAIKCEKVQMLFNTFINENQNQSEECYRVLRDNYLLSPSLEEKKFVPPIQLEIDNNTSNKSNENRSTFRISTRKRKKTLEAKNIINNGETLPVDLFVKHEVPSDDDRFDELLTPGIPSDSDEDYNIPLANVTDINKKVQKVKVKKTKISSKVKKKKNETKKEKKHNVISQVEELCIKAEPLSDSENCNEDINIIQRDANKIKKEKKDSSLPFLKYDCYICGEDAKNWNALCIHFRDVHDARAKIMCCCGKFLASRVSISRHSAKHGKGTNTFECGKCKKRFPRESELRTHMISHLPKEEHPFVCCKCGRRFTTQQLLRHHEKKHIPMEERLIHDCQTCSSKFASKSSLMMHMKAVHERLKPFVCDQCGRAFTTKGILEEHQVRHSDARPHVCTVCHKSFKTKQRLTIHSDTHNDTVYQCPHCPIRLNSRRTLRMHLFVHDEVCRYQCNFCDKAFKRAKDLKNHSNLHTGRRPYSCPWCSRTFANGSNCRAHKRRMHPNELRISDATAAMVNKVPVPPSDEVEEKQSSESGPPKVIYTTVKRKLPSTSIQPNFVFPPDASDKDFKREATKDVPCTKSSGQTKSENHSPVHNNYESSMSPLNLNTTASNKEAEPTLSVPPLTQAENVAGDFQSVADNYHSLLQNKIMETLTGNDFKENHENLFSKNPHIYTSFGNNLYNIASTTSQFATNNPYGIHFSREEGHS